MNRLHAEKTDGIRDYVDLERALARPMQCRTKIWAEKKKT